MRLEPGHLGLLLSVLSVLLALHAFNAKRLKEMNRNIKKLMLMRVEHEFLIDLLCDITGKKRSDLPTRHPDGRLIDSDTP
jgi:hypothetical protein